MAFEYHYTEDGAGVLAGMWPYFAESTGDAGKAYRYDSFAVSIQSALLEEFVQEVLDRLGEIADGEYAEAHNAYRQGLHASMVEMKAALLEVQEARESYEPEEDDEYYEDIYDDYEYDTFDDEDDEDEVAY
jgi:hypothetical protein